MSCRRTSASLLQRRLKRLVIVSRVACAVLLADAAAAAAIQSSSILVLRLDTGATAGVGVLSALHWDEVNVAAALAGASSVLQQIGGTYSNNGQTASCTLAAGVTGSWIYDHDGFPSNSADGTLAMTICFPAAVGGHASLGDSNNGDPGKTFVTLDYTGVVKFSSIQYNIADGGTGYSSGIRQLASVNGTIFYVCGEAYFQQGFLYVPLNNPGYVSTVSGYFAGQPGFYDSRAVVIYNGQLYGSDSNVYDAGWGGIFTIGTGMPTRLGSPAAKLLPGFSGSASLWTFVFQSSTQLWAATDGYGGGLGSVVSYMQNASGVWSQVVVQVVNATTGVYSITGRFESGNFIIFAATVGNVYRWDSTTPGATPITIYTPPAGGTVRGVALAPTSPTPSPTPTPTDTS